MDGMKSWSMAGLGFGIVLGIAAGFGGFGAFIAVLLLGIVGFLVGRALDGELDFGAIFNNVGSRRRPS